VFQLRFTLLPFRTKSINRSGAPDNAGLAPGATATALTVDAVAVTTDRQTG
jgi:hypothetical protein